MAQALTSWFARRLVRRSRAFARHQRGVTAIEFGLLAMPFFAIIGAILETSIVFLAGQVLDSAVHDVSRFIRTGQAQTATPPLNVNTFRDEVCERTYNLFTNCDDMFIDVRIVTNFQSATVAPPIDEDECEEEEDCEWDRPQVYNGGQASDIVLVQVYYQWPILLNLGGLSLANMPGGKRLLASATVLQNEPFPGSGL